MNVSHVYLQYYTLDEACVQKNGLYINDILYETHNRNKTDRLEIVFMSLFFRQYVCKISLLYNIIFFQVVVYTWYLIIHYLCFTASYYCCT